MTLAFAVDSQGPELMMNANEISNRDGRKFERNDC